ncbi:MAG: helix-hairpin-helix domain-containing protein, partial [Lonepinella koalarum]|nr:helix-hairpin-helix domain-containing protein [Lonepinella koalarum]
DKTKNAKEALSEKATSVKDAVVDKAKNAKETVSEKATSVKEVVAEKVEPSAKVNLNTADAATLQQLSGIGDVKAKAIIDYRNKVGKFKSVEDLNNVPGIGEATIEKIKPFLTF